MNTSNATRMADFASGIGTGGAVLQIDNDTDRIGIGTDSPQGMLQVGTAITMGGNTGIISATVYNADSTVNATLGVNVGSAITMVGATGVVSATGYYGDTINAGTGVTITSAGVVNVGSGITIGATAGVVSATTYYGDKIQVGSGHSTATLEISGFGAQGGVGIGTTNATGAADPQNTTVVNVGILTAVTSFGNAVGTAATYTTVTGNVTGDVTGNVSGTSGGLSGSPSVTVTNIVGTAATFSGTVTYEDVTNVDSVGVVTGRGGFEIGASGVGGTITSAGNATFVGILTVSTGTDLNGYKVESGYIDGATSLNGGFDCDLANGQIQRFSAATGGNYFPDFRIGGGVSLDSVLDVGDVVSVTLIVASSSHYCTTGIEIDNSTSNLDIDWVGGSAPSAANGSGFDVYAFTIQKTAATPAYHIIGNTLGVA